MALASCFAPPQLSHGHPPHAPLHRFLKHVEESPVFKANYLLGELLEKQGNRPAAAEEYRAASP